jgi:signal peptidase I
LKKRELIIVLAIVAVVLILRFIVFRGEIIAVGCSFPIKIASSSMEPALNEGGIVFATKIECINQSELGNGTIIVYRRPDNMLAVGRIYDLKDSEVHIRKDRDPPGKPAEVVRLDDVVGVVG